MTDTTVTVPERFLRRKEVARRIGVGLWTIWAWSKDGRFPPSYRLNPNGVNSPIGWKESEVEAWIANRPTGFGEGTPNSWRGVARYHRRRAVERRTGLPVILGPTASGLCRMAPLPEAQEVGDRAWSAPDWSDQKEPRR
jgi:prophage regulatory protein